MTWRYLLCLIIGHRDPVGFICPRCGMDFLPPPDDDDCGCGA